MCHMWSLPSQCTFLTTPATMHTHPASRISCHSPAQCQHDQGSVQLARRYRGSWHHALSSCTLAAGTTPVYTAGPGATAAACSHLPPATIYTTNTLGSRMMLRCSPGCPTQRGTLCDDDVSGPEPSWHSLGPALHCSAHPSPATLPPPCPVSLPLLTPLTAAAAASSGTAAADPPHSTSPIPPNAWQHHTSRPQLTQTATSAQLRASRCHACRGPPGGAAPRRRPRSRQCSASPQGPQQQHQQRHSKQQQHEQRDARCDGTLQPHICHITHTTVLTRHNMWRRGPAMWPTS